METYKSKSLSDKYTDNDMKRMYGVTRFISFESAIQLFRDYTNTLGIGEKTIGYKVTEQGIEILYE